MININETLEELQRKKDEQDREYNARTIIATTGMGAVLTFVYLGSHLIWRADKNDINSIRDSDRKILNRYDSNHNLSLEPSELRKLLNDYHLEEN